jgi:hypothetical protein
MTVRFTMNGNNVQFNGIGCVVLFQKPPENNIYDTKLMLSAEEGYFGFSSACYRYEAYESKEAALAAYPDAFDPENPPLDLP